MHDLDPKLDGARSKREIHLANLCIEAGLPAPVMGHRVHANREPFEFLAEVDLAWPELCKGVELDSLAHHLGVAAGTYDASRQQRLEDLADWKIRRFWTWQVRDNPTYVIRQVRSFLFGSEAR